MTMIDDDSCMVGNLETWPLSDLTMWLNNSGRTAMIRIGADLNAGILFFHAGQLTRAEWGQLHGEHAVYALLNVRQGLFTVIQRKMTANPNITISTEQLLLQHAVARDELQRKAVA